MKFVAFVVASVLAICHGGVLNDEQMAKAMKLHEECLKETGADPAICLKAKNGEFVDDPKLKEQILCFNKKANFQNSDGKFNIDIIRSHINQVLKDEKLTNSLVDKCVKDLDTPQESAFQAAKCLYPSEHKL